ncbi:MAG: UDP-galactopyranose mutase [Ilumatobacter sp.]|uniref:UDP-galactopyranose/dTDP-fucopyranose mutase family protein n=1 Tax=Ilumatobacter sp. TaxID=1967498 RepID=UPI0032974150
MQVPLTIAVAGAGLSGAVVARELADAGHGVTVFEGRDHVAGNCHTERDDTGVLVHRYGPHIFHTASERVWAYMNRFGEMVPYRHRVRATARGEVFGLPVNLTTINQLFGTSMTGPEAERFVAARAEPYRDRPATTFRDRGLATIGPELFEAFFDGYTRKQWGVEPDELPAEVFSRLPLRFDDDDSYFDHPFQGMPRAGYTAVVQSMLHHPNIEVRLGAPLDPADCDGYDHTFWTGPLDAFFGRVDGPLTYRTIDFVTTIESGDHQGCAVMNHCDRDVPHTRVTEHKHLAPWETHDGTVVSEEHPREWVEGDIPYYPVRLALPTERVDGYVARAAATASVTFLGRLGTYRYLDMDVAVGEALECADAFLAAIDAGVRPPVFTVEVDH